MDQLREEFGDIVIDKGACIDWSSFPTTGPTAPVTDCRDTEDSRAIQAFSSVSERFDWKGAPQLFKVALSRNTKKEIGIFGILLSYDVLGMRVDQIKPESPSDVWNAACEQSCPTDKLLIGDLIIQVNDVSIPNGWQAMVNEFQRQLDVRLVVRRGSP